MHISKYSSQKQLHFSIPNFLKILKQSVYEFGNVGRAKKFGSKFWTQEESCKNKNMGRLKKKGAQKKADRKKRQSRKGGSKTLFHEGIDS